MAGSGTPGAARAGCLIRALILVACIAISLPVLYGSGRLGLLVRPGCGCTSMSSPYSGGGSPAPWPVTASQAAAEGKRFAGSEMVAAEWSPNTAQLYELRAVQTYGFVDGETGGLLEISRLDRMPTLDAVTVTPDAAQAAARAYLEQAGMRTVGMTSSVQLQNRASMTYYDVVWKDADGTGRLEVFVNTSTGTVFAFEDLGFGPKFSLAMPIVGATAASNLAQASTYAAGEPAMSTDFEVMAGLAGEPAFGWTVVFNDGVLNVDAVTGEVAILKWSALR
jgi:hypothetical protein